MSVYFILKPFVLVLVCVLFRCLTHGDGSFFLFGNHQYRHCLFPGVPFYTWLQDPGYNLWTGSRGYSKQSNWVYVNLNSRLFCSGIPMIQPMGSHANTIDEFQQIHTLSIKRSHLPPLVIPETVLMAEAEWDEQGRSPGEVSGILERNAPGDVRKLV